MSYLAVAIQEPMFLPVQDSEHTQVPFLPFHLLPSRLSKWESFSVFLPLIHSFSFSHACLWFLCPLQYVLFPELWPSFSTGFSTLFSSVWVRIDSLMRKAQNVFVWNPGQFPGLFDGHVHHLLTFTLISNVQVELMTWHSLSTQLMKVQSYLQTHIISNRL